MVAGRSRPLCFEVRWCSCSEQKGLSSFINQMISRKTTPSAFVAKLFFRLLFGSSLCSFGCCTVRRHSSLSPPLAFSSAGQTFPSFTPPQAFSFKSRTQEEQNSYISMATCGTCFAARRAAMTTNCGHHRRPSYNDVKLYGFDDSRSDSC